MEIPPEEEEDEEESDSDSNYVDDDSDDDEFDEIDDHDEDDDDEDVGDHNEDLPVDAIFAAAAAAEGDDDDDDDELRDGGDVARARQRAAQQARRLNAHLRATHRRARFDNNNDASLLRRTLRLMARLGIHHRVILMFVLDGLLNQSLLRHAGFGGGGGDSSSLPHATLSAAVVLFLFTLFLFLIPTVFAVEILRILLGGYGPVCLAFAINRNYVKSISDSAAATSTTGGGGVEMSNVNQTLSSKEAPESSYSLSSSSSPYRVLFLLVLGFHLDLTLLEMNRDVAAQLPLNGNGPSASSTSSPLLLADPQALPLKWKISRAVWFFARLACLSTLVAPFVVSSFPFAQRVSPVIFSLESSRLVSFVVPFAVVSFVVSKRLPSYWRQSKRVFAWARRNVDNFGILYFLEDQWTRLRVPRVLRTFFLLRIAVQCADLFLWTGVHPAKGYVINPMNNPLTCFSLSLFESSSSSFTSSSRNLSTSSIFSSPSLWWWWWWWRQEPVSMMTTTTTMMENSSHHPLAEENSTLVNLATAAVANYSSSSSPFISPSRDAFLSLVLPSRQFCAASSTPSSSSSTSPSFAFNSSIAFSPHLILLVNSADTCISLLGFSSWISFVTFYMGHLIQTFLGGRGDGDPDQDGGNMGIVGSILFFILGVQTGLTSMPAERRLVRLYKNFSLLVVALLHYVHSLVHPQLESLSASPAVPSSRYARTFAVCALLVLFPFAFIAYLWSRFTTSTWLFAVTVFGLELIVKVVVSLAVFVLFQVDANSDELWEPLDDYIYWVRALGGSVEFLFGVFLFCNGAWIMLFESGGTIRAVMMCIHAYFNIWQQAREGWTKFKKRRQSVNKIESMRDASAAQLERLHDDVCSICYNELASAKVTVCNHFFHGLCLRKWLYLQDNCPMCHRNIFEDEETSEPRVVE